MKAFTYYDATSVADAVGKVPATATADKYGQPAFLKAGGIDLLDQMKERLIEPDMLINLKGLESELRYIKEEGGVIKIGPLTTLMELEKSALLQEKFPALAQGANSAATPQIRTVATVGGNLNQRPRCWYFRNSEFKCLKKGGTTCFAQNGENQYHAVFGTGPSFIVHPSNTAPALVAAGAEFLVRGPAGERVVKSSEYFKMPNEVLLRENILKPNEMIAEIRIPAGIKRSAYYEIQHKQSYDWALAGAAAVETESKGWNVVLFAVAPIPWRSTAAEEVLGKNAMTKELAEAAGKAAITGARPLKHNAYKLDLIPVAVKRALLAAAGMEA